MASNDIKFKVIATADGFDIVQKKQKGLADQIDKTNKSTKQLDKTQEKNYGRQKQGLIQTANGTKNFSKLSQTIGGGSSGLVGAYATLAALIARTIIFPVGALSDASYISRFLVVILSLTIFFITKKNFVYPTIFSAISIGFVNNYF